MYSVSMPLVFDSIDTGKLSARTWRDTSYLDTCGDRTETTTRQIIANAFSGTCTEYCTLDSMCVYVLCCVLTSTSMPFYVYLFANNKQCLEIYFRMFLIQLSLGFRLIEIIGLQAWELLLISYWSYYSKSLPSYFTFWGRFESKICLLYTIFSEMYFHVSLIAISLGGICFCHNFCVYKVSLHRLVFDSTVIIYAGVRRNSGVDFRRLFQAPLARVF